MAKKKNTIPSGFEDVLGNIYSNMGTQDNEDGLTIIDDSMDIQDIPFEEEEEKKEPPVNTEDGNKKDDTTSSAAKEDDSEIPEHVLNQTSETDDDDTTEDNNEPSDADVIEAQQVGLLFDAIGQSFGWNMNDIDEKDRPLTVEGLTDYFREVINQNSVPQYADDRIKQLDEYVKNGGKFEDFYTKQSDTMSLDNIDMDDEANQKAVIRELLKYNNYSDEQINKKISRYEDADMLYEESEDALDRLKTIRKEQLAEATRQQEEYARQQEEQSRAFFNEVSKDIQDLTNIRGINVPKEDRKALFDYIFKVDQTGMSQYQKDFNKNLSKNLIESAYFTMKADSLLSTAKRDGESSATEKLRKLLRHQTKNHSTYNADDKQKSVTDLISGMF